MEITIAVMHQSYLKYNLSLINQSFIVNRDGRPPDLSGIRFFLNFHGKENIWALQVDYFIGKEKIGVMIDRLSPQDLRVQYAPVFPYIIPDLPLIPI